jgi:tRNA dimethylallyltransferase
MYSLVMTTEERNLIVVLGPTASGKTRFAALLAHAIQGEIISADSRQVYRQMDLGTGKDYGDYVVQGHTIASHLIDICDPGQKYHVHAFQKDFYGAFGEIHGRGHMPILCGGTGMYIEAVTQGYSLPAVDRDEALREALKDKTLEQLQEILTGFKVLHNRSDTDTRERAIRAIEIETHCESHSMDQEPRPQIKPFFFGLQLERALCRQRIAARLQQRFDAGMVDEVQGLLNQGVRPEDLIYYGLEYKFITQHLTGQMDYKTLVEKLYIAICQFSKRQMTWFRRMERKGTEIHWIDALQDDETKVKQAIQMMGTQS